MTALKGQGQNDRFEGSAAKDKSETPARHWEMTLKRRPLVGESGSAGVLSVQAPRKGGSGSV